MRIKRSKIALPFLLQEQIHQDEVRNLDFLIKRDREIATQNNLISKGLGAKLLGWLDELANEDLIALETRIISADFIIKSCLWILGFFSGFFTLYGLCNFDGTHPVNLVFLLGFFFLLQCISLLFFLFASLTRNSNGVFPFSFAYFFSRILSTLPSAWREFSERFFALSSKNHLIFGRLQKWFLIYLAQIFSFSFFIGVIAAFAILVTVSDLAFSWSSTLEVSADRIYSVTSTIAWPWSHLVVEAVPSLELIEGSRFFRLEERSGQAQARIFGLWWPFIGMSLLVYGLLPRLITYLISLLRFSKVLKKTSLILPGTSDVLARMDSKVVSLSVSEQKNTGQRQVQEQGLSVHTLSMKENTVVLNWGSASSKVESYLEEALPESQQYISKIFDVGGVHTTNHDLEIIREIETIEKKDEVLIIVKSWEPPRGDFTDFLKALRSVMKPGQIIGILMVGYGDGAIASGLVKKNVIKQMHLHAWSMALMKVEDPWLRLYGPDSGEEV